MRVAPDEPVAVALPRLPGVGAVVDGDDRFLGTITDAAVRRRLLTVDDAGAVLAGDCLDADPVAVGPGTGAEAVRTLLAARHVRAAAVVDGDRFLGKTDVAAPVPPAWAVVLAGGRGSRLQPLTFKVPKPLLQVGGRSILERVLDTLHASHIDDVFLAVNYMADTIEERVGDGAHRGVRIRYLREEEPLETAGALALLPEPPPGPVVVLNADQITNLSFARMVDYHLAEQAAITVGAMRHEVVIPYGVLDVGEDGGLQGLREKPTVGFTCNAGFYVVSPSVLPLVPAGRPFKMTDLVDTAMAGGERVVVFPMVERWIDIGTPEELEKALLWFATGEEV